MTSFSLGHDLRLCRHLLFCLVLRYAIRLYPISQYESLKLSINSAYFRNIHHPFVYC